MKTIFNLLLWLAAGLILGVVLFAFMQKPLEAGTNTTNATTPAPPGIPVNASNGTNFTAPEANVTLTLIDTAECSKCVNGTQALQETLSYLDGQPNIRVASARKLDLTDPEAQYLVEKYQITQLPALLVSGDAVYPAAFLDTWNKSIGTREPDGVFVSRRFPAPYYDLGQGRIVGIVKAIGIDPYGCPECGPTSGFIGSLEGPSGGNVYFENKTYLEETSAEAQGLISKHNITRLPVVFLSSEIADYAMFPKDANLTLTSDGWYVIYNTLPPYVNLTGNRSVRGVVDEILITNSSCGDCLDINSLSDMITTPEGLKYVTLRNKTVFDISSQDAKSLVEKYGITAIPTLLLSPEIALYPGPYPGSPDFKVIWVAQNNTIESDGWFVFRDLDLIGQKYQNISG